LVSPVTTASGKVYGTTGVGEGVAVGDGDAVLGADDGLGRGVASPQAARIATTTMALTSRTGSRTITPLS
jgi:hypothetical protein